MPGNRDLYQKHLNNGHDAAWQGSWQAAVKAYSQAVQEIPEEPEAHIHLGLALLKAGRLDDALRIYKKAHQLAPDDPIPLERSADVLERMGRLKEAAEQYVNVADIYLAKRDLDKAIGTWERATQLTPGLVTIHAKLAQAYERIGDNKKAVREYLKLAFNFRRVNEVEKAIKAVERALRLDKKHPQALNAMAALKRGGEIILPDDMDEKKPKQREQEEEFSLLFSELEDDGGKASSVGDADPRGPIGEALNDGLELLAQYVVESGTLDEAGSDALQAMQLQRQEQYDEAIAAYQRASSRLNHPALKLNLGALLLVRDRPEEAIKHLGEAIMDPQISAGAFHGLGQAYTKLKQPKKAYRYFVQSLQAVDTSLAVNDEEVSDLEAVYDRLISALGSIDDDTLINVNQRFEGLLTGKDWKQRIADTRRHLEETMKTDDDVAIREFIADSGRPEITDAVSKIDRYIRQGLYTLAMDEAHRAVEHSPFYLPVHVRMAEIMMREGRVRQAISKYDTVAKSYLVRGENDRAATILSEVLEMAPLDISIRRSLIVLLEGEQRWLEALDQYIDLANTYNKLSNFDMARDTYAAAEKLATRANAPVEKLVQIKHHVADLAQMRLDTRRAIKIYEEVVDLSPDDERAHKMLVDLNYGQNNQVEAIKRLDGLMALYAKTKQVNRITTVLEELVKHYPNDTGLRNRLAGIYARLNKKQQAIEQLDALGELQLEAGLHKEAANTIRQIIQLGPEHVEDYKKLLSQLGG
jgi:tetratricopeptide (TPR) repeat protein